MRVDSRLPSAVGTTISVTESHAQNTIPMIPPRCPVHSSRCRGSPTLNTERFHKREREQQLRARCKDFAGIVGTCNLQLGCRMKCPNSGIGTQEVSMNLSVTWAHRTLGDLSAVRMNETVELLLAQQTGIIREACTRFNA